MRLKIFVVVLLTGHFSAVWSKKLSISHEKGVQLEVKKVSSSAFAPFDGGDMSSINGCFVNRLDGGLGTDGNMYASLNLPVGSTIVSITAHFWDWAQSWHQRPILNLRTYQGSDLPVILASAQRESPINGPFFYEQDATVDPGYTVQEGDFLDLIFDSGNDLITNAYYICGVEVFYLPAIK